MRETRQSPFDVRAPGAWLMADTMKGVARRRAAMALLFLLPTLAGLLVFSVGPVLFSLGLSLYRWDIVDPARFVGLHNYQRLIHDPQVLTSFRNTAVFVVLDVALQTLVGLGLALSLFRLRAIWLRYLFRSALFLPLITSGAAVAVLLSYMFNEDLGVINYYIGSIGLPRIHWLNDPSGAMVTIVLTAVWQQQGFTFLVFLGGLGAISKEILEAADVDGAGGWSRLRFIILPLLSPSILFVAVIGAINALQVITEPNVMTQGGPGDATRTVVMVIYQSAFQYLQLGYGAAITTVLFVAILGVTAVQFRISNRWVFYQ